MEGADVIFYQFSRSKVDRGDFSHFLGMFAFNKLPTGRKLRKMMGNMILCIDGYDDDDRELYQIDPVRKFYRQFHCQWPYSFYFANLDQGALKINAYCNIDDLTDLKVKGESKVMVAPNQAQMIQFISGGFGAMNQVCQRAEMFDSLVEQRSKAIMNYFGLADEGAYPG